MDVASASVSTGLPEAVVVLLREGDADMREKVRRCMMVRMCRVHVAIPYTSFCRCMESQKGSTMLLFDVAGGGMHVLANLQASACS